MSEEIRLIMKSDVIARLNISERTLEKLIKARRFPSPLRIGKRVQWVESVVSRWLEQAVAAQMSWEPPKRTRRSTN